VSDPSGWEQNKAWDEYVKTSDELQEKDARIAELEAQVRDLQTTNHRRLCGCEESAGVLGCAVGCACRCHRLEAQTAAMREALEYCRSEFAVHPSCAPDVIERRVHDALSSTAGTDHEQRIRAEERERLTAIIERDVSNGYVARHLIDAIRALKDE
jgi:hypothetical protein